MTGESQHHRELKPRIIVFGVGGAGGNAVNNMIAGQLEGVEFVVANTDSQALARAQVDHRFQLGPGITEGLGAGARPEVGRRAAEDSLGDIADRVKDAHMVFVTAGMGGGTGTGAAPVIARAARDAGALVVAVVTKPFDFEGSKRMRIATEGVRELEREVDTLIVIPNQNLFRIANEKTSISEAFVLADSVLRSAVRGVTDLMTRPGIVNLDFADVRTVMSEMGKAVMGAGESEGAERAAEAAHEAVSNPLVDDITLKGAKAVLINITGGPDLTLFDIDEAANAIRAEVDPEANIIVGSAIDGELGARVRVSVLATGIDTGPNSAAVRRAAAHKEASGTDRAAAAGFTFEPPIREATMRRPPEPDDAGEPEADQEERPPLVLTEAIGPAPAAFSKTPAADAEAEENHPISNAANASDAQEPVEPANPFGAPAEEDAGGRGGGFSLFGRRRRRETEFDTPQDAAQPDASEEEEDELEIPAFLRRQAN